MPELRVTCNPDDKVSQDEHKHLCECGTCWKHSNAVQQTTKAEFNVAHTCPTCGNDVREKHDDDEALALTLCELLDALLERIAA